MVSNSFAYDRAGNRLATKSHKEPQKRYADTSDNQLTGIFWSSDKVTLGGYIEQAWTVLWVRVQQNAAGSQPFDASLTCQRNQSVAGKARGQNGLGSGVQLEDITGHLMFSSREALKRLSARADLV